MAHLVEAAAMFGMLAMAEVQACDVHARLDQSPASFRAIGGRTERADDFCAAGHSPSVLATRELPGHGQR
jgi:hypothetical protein